MFRHVTIPDVADACFSTSPLVSYGQGAQACCFALHTRWVGLPIGARASNFGVLTLWVDPVAYLQGCIGLLIGLSMGIDRSVGWSPDGLSIRLSERAVLLPQSPGRACTTSISTFFFFAEPCIESHT